MKLKLISCDVFIRSVCQEIALTGHIVDPEFTPLGAHENPNTLRNMIQSKIDQAEGKGYDAILLAYGLCGNSAVGLKARSIPLIIPRAHDCCTILLGSRQRFLECFKDNLSGRWSSVGYMERGASYLHDTDTGKLLGLNREYEEYVRLYGKENADFIWETLHPKDTNTELIYIETPGLEHLGYLEKFEKEASKEGKTVLVLQGDTKLIHGLLHGNWDEEEYLIVFPGKTIKAIYDHEKIFCAGE
jgi:hypothetical protein